MNRAKHKWRIIFWAIAALLLLTPLVAMQFTDAVQWDQYDFLIFGAMLLIAGVAIELSVRLTRTTRRRVGLIIAIILAFLLIWAQLAVGIFN